MIEAIHPTAIVRGDVSLGAGASIGPYCVIEGTVKIGAGTKILGHTTIQGTTYIGERCKIGPHAAVGTDPQFRAYDGSETLAIIEDDVIIREFATVHRSAKHGADHATRIGKGSMLMVGSHVAHDCHVGEFVTLANGVLLAGHVTIGDRAFLGGGVGIHQFVRVGRLAMIAGGEGLAKDVMPFGAVFHDRHKGYNAIGCRRAGLDPRQLRELRSAFREIHSSRSAIQAAKKMRAEGLKNAGALVKELVEFIEASKRGIQPSAAGEEAQAEE